MWTVTWPNGCLPFAEIRLWMFVERRVACPQWPETNYLEENESADEPSKAVEVEDETIKVMGHLEKLPNNQQEVIRLKFQNGLKYKEISSVTGLSVSNVGFLIHRGLKTLREKLRKELAADL